METENKQNIKIFIYTDNKYKGTQYIYVITGVTTEIFDNTTTLYNNFDAYYSQYLDKHKNLQNTEQYKEIKEEFKLFTAEHYKEAFKNIKIITTQELYKLTSQKHKDYITDNIVNHVVTHKKKTNKLYNYYYQDTNRIYNIFVYNDTYARTLRKIDNSRKLNNLLDIGVNFNEDDLYIARKNKKQVRLKYFNDIDRLATKEINNKLYLNLSL